MYFATRSVRDGAPVLIWPAFTATARSAIVVSSVSPERWEITVAYPAARRDLDRLQRLGQRPDLVHLDENCVPHALCDPSPKELLVRHEEVVADELDRAAQLLGQRAPLVPGVLVEAVLDRDERIALRQRGVEVDHRLGLERAPLARELVAPVLEDLARCRVESNPDPLAMTCALGGLEDRLDRLLGRLQIGREASLVPHAGRKPTLVQHRLQVMEDLCPHAQSLAIGLGAGRNDHELLEVQPVLGVRSAVDDVHERDRQRVRTVPTEPAIERELGLVRGRLGGGERAAEDGIRPEPALPAGSVQVDEDAIERCLVGGVETRQRLGHLAVDVGNGLQNALAQVRRAIAVPKLDCFVLTGRRARWNCRATERSRGEADIDLDGRVASRVEDLAAVHVDDGAHGSSSFARS